MFRPSFYRILNLVLAFSLGVAILINFTKVLAQPLQPNEAVIRNDFLQQEGTILEINGSPLRIFVGSDNRLQVFHENYTHGASYGEAGSGFFLAIGQDVYGPFTYPLVSISHEGPTGRGTREDPFLINTVQQLTVNTVNLEVAQTVMYVNGNNYFQLEWQITNRGDEQTCFKAYHAADLYFADDDYGLGYYNSRTGSIGGFNRERTWFMVFTPRTAATHYEEGYYATIWDHVYTATDLQDRIDESYIDNGAALQWDKCLNGGQSTTLSDLWSFGESEREVLQVGQEAGFRPPGPLTPELTTYIPTPLDISTDPAVVGTNLLFAALVMVLFTISSDVLKRTLAENEAFVQRLVFPLKGIRDFGQQVKLRERFGNLAWYELIKLIIIVLIYGFIYSLLDRSWKPFSLTGVYLFFSMCLVYGITGLTDDMAKWLFARRMKLATSLIIRPGNLLVSIASTTFTRLFGLVPGIMIGAPTAFNIDPTTLDRRKENNLAMVAAATLVSIGIAAWLPTVLTALIQRVALPGFFLAWMGGIQSLLLLMFAVIVQNVFAQMLDLPDTFGRALKRTNIWLWGMGLFVATFIFFHMLVNPQGDLAQSLASTNVRFFFIIIGLFLLFTLSTWSFFKIYNTLRKQQAAQLQPPSTGLPQIMSQAKKTNIWVWVLLIGLVLFFLCLALICVASIVWRVLIPAIRSTP